MRYQRLLVRNFRGVREAEVTFPDGRLLVIEGPNEAGKSSLVEAIWLLFDYPAESNAEEVRSVRPAGLDADPEVELEFSLGAVRCRYRKVFGRRGVTELETVGEVTRRLTGREAHDAAKQLLRERVDEALLRALRVLQGQSLLPPSGLDGSPGLQRALDAGAADTVGEGIFERVREACRQYWTDKRWAATGDLRHAMLDRDQARELVEKLEQRVARLAALEQRVAEMEPERDGLREEEAQLKARLAELAEQRAAFEEARREAELAEQAAETAGERRRRLESEVQQREAARREAAALEREVRELEAELAARQAAATEARQRAEAAAQTAETARAALAGIEEAAKLAGDDYAYLQEELQLAQMEDRLRALDEALERREAARAFLAACRVDGQKLEEIEQAADAVRQTEAQMKAATAQVEVTGPDGAAVVVDGAEQRLGGEPLRLDAAEERRIELPGGFAVVVRPSRSQALLEGRLAERRRRLEEMLGEAGAASVEAARELEQRRRDAERDIAESDRAAKQALRDLPDREDLAGRIARTRERVEGYRTAHAGRRLPATLEEARRLKAASDDERGRAQQQAEAAAAAASEAGEAAAAAERELAALEARLDGARNQLDGVRQQLATAEQARPQAALDADVAAARGEAELAEQRAAAARQRAEELAGAALEAEEAGRRLEAVQQRLRKLEEEMTEARGALRHEGEGSLQAELDEARSRLDHAEGKLLEVQRRAAAAKLLFETLERHRNAARRIYGPRLEERIAVLGRRVFGEEFAIHLDDRLAPAERTLNGQRLPFEQLSIGAKEQVSVLYRAACAAAAAADGVPLVLDDALGWSDESRLEGLAGMLAELAREVQVVVLTCQPGRFGAVQDAVRLRMEQGVAGPEAGAAGEGS